MRLVKISLLIVVANIIISKKVYAVTVTNSWVLKTKNNCKGFKLKDNGC